MSATTLPAVPLNAVIVAFRETGFAETSAISTGPAFTPQPGPAAAGGTAQWIRE